MHIISKTPLRAFWTTHPRAKSALEQWYRTTRKSNWKSFADVRASLSTADWYQDFVIFDIGGNKYRLIASIHFNRGKVFVLDILTHAEYSRGDWKKTLR